MCQPVLGLLFRFPFPKRTMRPIPFPSSFVFVTSRQVQCPSSACVSMTRAALSLASRCVCLVVHAGDHASRRKKELQKQRRQAVRSDVVQSMRSAFSETPEELRAGPAGVADDNARLRRSREIEEERRRWVGGLDKMARHFLSPLFLPPLILNNVAREKGKKKTQPHAFCGCAAQV